MFVPCKCHHWPQIQTILTSRVAVLGTGAACLLVANVQTGSIIEDYYKGQASRPCAEWQHHLMAFVHFQLLQMVERVGEGFCPEPQPAGPEHIDRHTVVADLDRILMQDQPSKFYYVITGAHGKHC